MEVKKLHISGTPDMCWRLLEKIVVYKDGTAVVVFKNKSSVKKDVVGSLPGRRRKWKRQQQRKRYP